MLKPPKIWSQHVAPENRPKRPKEAKGSSSNQPLFRPFEPTDFHPQVLKAKVPCHGVSWQMLGWLCFCGGGGVCLRGLVFLVEKTLGKKNKQDFRNNRVTCDFCWGELWRVFYLDYCRFGECSWCSWGSFLGAKDSFLLNWFYWYVGFDGSTSQVAHNTASATSLASSKSFWTGLDQSTVANCPL